MAKKMKLSADNKMLLGVCGGAAETFGINPNWVRGGYALFVLLSCGFWWWAYFLVWFLIKKEII